MCECELAWAAGFFDGDGHAGAYKGPNGKHYLKLYISQKGLEVLERFHKAVEYGTLYGPDKRGVYQYQLTGSKAVLVVDMLWKYLSSPKRTQIQTAISKTN